MRESTDRRVPHLGTYRRELPVSLERLYENAIDWEHLPYLHKTSFARIECARAGPSGFLARVWPQPYDEGRSFVIELKLDRELHRWITSTLEGPGAGTEIWTHAFRLGKRRTFVVVDFFVPGLKDDSTARLCDFYVKLYSRLYDEDAWMMSERQRQLDVVKIIGWSERRPVALGSVTQLRTAVPGIVEVGGEKFRIVESDGELIAHSIVCPHRLGPLGESEVRGGVVECPWHGHRFDIRSGRCLSGAACALAPAPRIRIDMAGQVVLQWPEASSE